jgi:hypothetical protein
MATRIEIVVKTCEGCPFYQRGVISAIGDALAKDNRKTGLCEYNARTRGPSLFAGLFYSAHIAEPSAAPPPTCPLRQGETTIKLASGA